jgi:hypothetical protein
MSGQVVPSILAQGVIVKFLTNENVKCPEILNRRRVQFGGETLSRTPVYDWSNSLKDGRTEVEKCEDYNFCKESYDQRFF